MTPQDLPSLWRQRALDLEEYALPAARAFQTAARELEDALRATDAELLTLAQAANLSGYSSDHLGRLIRDGKVPNFGRRGAPRLRRGDLPQRPERVVAAQGPRAYDPQTDARTLVARREGGVDAP